MLRAIHVDAVRNLETQEIELDERLTLAVGRNAQGKSSLLESAYILATTRSYRTRDPREAIRHGADLLTLKGVVSGAAGILQEPVLGLARERGNRRLSVGEYPAKLVDYLGLQSALALSGESGRAVVGSPSERRRYMDRAAAARRPGYVNDLAEYRRSLAQRNALLRENASDAELDAWDEIVARAGESVATRRREQLADWHQEVGAWPELFPEGASVRFEYAGTGEGELHDRLSQRRPGDRKLGATTVGPHRDDFEARTDGRSLWRFGSAGQVRALLAVVLLAQARLITRRNPDRRPLIVLDDVDTDLDVTRVSRFLEAARDEGQVFAATSKEALSRETDGRVLRVSEGVASAG